MSERLKTIHGKIELATRKLRPEYKDQAMILSSFNGGKLRGHSLSITIGDKQIQLDNSAVKELIKELINKYL